MPRSLTGDLLRLLAATLIGALLLAAFATFRIWQVGGRDERGQPADAVVVLGAAQYDGRPSPVYAARLDHAVALVLSDVAPLLVLTGGRAPGDRQSEGEVGRLYAIERGVDPAAIVAESQGRDTLTSMRNVDALLEARGVRRAIFVSDPTHMLRILTIARDLGIDAHSSPTSTSPIAHDATAWADAALHELGALAAYHLAGG